jgi:hypothetical protein
VGIFYLERRNDIEYFIVLATSYYLPALQKEREADRFVQKRYHSKRCSIGEQKFFLYTQNFMLTGKKKYLNGLRLSAIYKPDLPDLSV